MVRKPLEALILDGLDRRLNAVGYAISRGLAELFPERALVEGQAPVFDLEGYARAGLCHLQQQDVPHARRMSHWIDPERGQVERAAVAFYDVLWEDQSLSVLVVHWNDQMSQAYHYFILADAPGVAASFHAAVCTWATPPEPDDYILVFDVNGWSKDEALLAAIAQTTLDQVVLRGTMKEEILHDLSSFFTSRELYAEYGVPWKRGILLLGPPGNGKTHATKALINTLGQRCVYVRTFSRGMPDVFAIRAVFDRARDIAPCLVVLEDLDAMITPENRSYFLNELDGFAGNDGILTLATTNHPERLDPAILDRPSRFDRKYPFDLPGPEERAAYIRRWNETLKPDLRLSEEIIPAIVEATEGFSFAYLKELFLAAVMRWVTDAQPGTMDRILVEQAAVLGDQMATVMELLEDASLPPPHAPRHVRHGPGRGHMFPPGPQHDTPEIPL